MALKFTVHVIQSFIKGHRKSGVISIKYSRDITNWISPYSSFSTTHVLYLGCLWSIFRTPSSTDTKWSFQASVCHEHLPWMYVCTSCVWESWLIKCVSTYMHVRSMCMCSTMSYVCISSSLVRTYVSHLVWEGLVVQELLLVLVSYD